MAEQKKPAGTKLITTKVGLILPVPRIEHYIREASTRDRVSYATATAVSAVVGYVLEELIELSLYAMKEMRKARLTTVHMLHALNSNPELAAIIPMSSLGTGTVPHPQPDDEVDSEGEIVKKKKRSHKRRRPTKSARRSHSRRRSTRRSRRMSIKKSASRSRLIHRLIKSISRSRGRSPAAKKHRTEAFNHLVRLSRSRSRSRSYSRNKNVAARQRVIDRIVDVISRSRSRSRSPDARKTQAEGFRHLFALSRSRSRSRTRGGRPARETQYKGTKAGKRLVRGTGALL